MLCEYNTSHIQEMMNLREEANKTGDNVLWEKAQAIINKITKKERYKEDIEALKREVPHEFI